MTRSPKVPELKNEARIHLALDIAAHVTEILCNLRGIEIAASGYVPGGPKDWTPGYGSGDIRYTTAAQRVFNDSYSQAREIISDVFGPDKRQKQKPHPGKAGFTDLKFPKLPNEVRIHLAVEIAEKLTELVCIEKRITIIDPGHAGGPKDWNPGGEPGEIRYTEAAQDVFNGSYDTAHSIIDDVFGPE